jgi:hypothetical protein
MRIDRFRRFGRFLAGAALSFAALGTLSGCPGTLDDKERFLVDAGIDNPDAGTGGGECGDVPARIFVTSCGDTGCHGATAPQQELDLVSSGLDARIVGVQAKSCSGILADPQSPAGSVLYSKLLNQPKCGSQMPLARPPLSDADRQCVLAWIAAQ